MVFILLAGFLLTISAAAVCSAGVRPIVAILPVIDNSSQKSGRFAVSVIEERMAEKFGNGQYIVLSGQKP